MISLDVQMISLDVRMISLDVRMISLYVICVMPCEFNRECPMANEFTRAGQSSYVSLHVSLSGGDCQHTRESVKLCEFAREG